jgi:hypothetical protein
MLRRMQAHPKSGVSRVRSRLNRNELDVSPATSDPRAVTGADRDGTTANRIVEWLS